MEGSVGIGREVLIHEEDNGSFASRAIYYPVNPISSDDVDDQIPPGREIWGLPSDDDEVELMPLGERRWRRRGDLMFPSEAHDNAHRYLEEILAGHGIEAELMYVGDPGDYVDATEFEHILHHLAENENGTRDPHRASKSAIDSLVSLVIEAEQEQDGNSHCAICKDVVLVGTVAKQLPCSHLYHPDCILPWLGARNTRPLCRFKLPIEDPDADIIHSNLENDAHYFEPLTYEDRNNLENDAHYFEPPTYEDRNLQTSFPDSLLVERFGDEPQNAVVEGDTDSERESEISVSNGCPNEHGGGSIVEVPRGFFSRALGTGWIQRTAGSIIGLVVVLFSAYGYIGVTMRHFGRHVSSNGLSRGWRVFYQQ